jgi:hypothetical protein
MNPFPGVAASKRLTVFTIEDLAMRVSPEPFLPPASGPLRRLILCAALGVASWAGAVYSLRRDD